MAALDAEEREEAEAAAAAKAQAEEADLVADLVGAVVGWSGSGGFLWVQGWCLWVTRSKGGGGLGKAVQWADGQVACYLVWEFKVLWQGSETAQAP